MPSKTAKPSKQFQDSEWVNKLKWSQAEECQHSSAIPVSDGGRGKGCRQNADVIDWIVDFHQMFNKRHRWAPWWATWWWHTDARWRMEGGEQRASEKHTHKQNAAHTCQEPHLLDHINLFPSKEEGRVPGERKAKQSQGKVICACHSCDK